MISYNAAFGRLDATDGMTRTALAAKSVRLGLGVAPMVEVMMSPSLIGKGGVGPSSWLSVMGAGLSQLVGSET